MGQVTSRCERRRSIRLPPIATEESYGSSVCSVRTGHSILDSNRFEQSLSYVLTEHGLRVTSNIFYDESMNILDNTTALHDARIFILQVHQQGLKHSPSVRQKWQIHKDGLKLAGLRAYSNAVDKWFDAIDAGGKRGPPPALGKDAHVLYEVDMMSQPGPERPAQVELPQVAARLEGYAELTTLQKIIREKLQTPALIEVTLGADLSERKQRQIGKQRELAKHLGCTSVLFYNGMQDANIDIHEETISVWISRENVEHFALRKAQKEAEMALQQRQGFSTTSEPVVVWVRELAQKDGTIIAKSRQEGEDKLEPAFQVESPQDHPTLKNVDHLKKAIKQMNPDLKDIAPRHIDIYLRSKEAGEWKPVEGASTSLRQDTSELDCYGFLPWRPT